MSAKQKVIIDCDPGIDDSLALLLALNSPELDVIGITIVCGNVPVSLGADNALKILRLGKRLDIPVYIGAKKPLIRDYISAQDTHGVDGLGETNIPAVTNVYAKSGAIDFINQSLLQYPDLTIIAIGPLTNIAIALKKQPTAWKSLKNFISMGGAYKSYGNCSPVAEYNYWCDPDAANYVYSSLPCKITMVGLDVTRKIVLTPNILEYICAINPKMGSFIRAITRFYFDFHWQQEKVIGCVINDPLAIAYAITPTLCEGFDAYTQIETTGISLGQSIVDAQNIFKHVTNSHILTKVDDFKFMHMFLERIATAKEPELTQTLAQIMVKKGRSTHE